MVNQFATETPWSPQRIEALERLVACGYSSQKIANALGDVTRNAVIGKVRRMKLKLKTRQGVRGEGKKPPPAELKLKFKKPPASANPHRYPPQAIAEPSTPTLEPEPAGPAIDPFLFGAQGKGVSFDDLKPHHCRWPICDVVAGPVVAYCGNDRTEPFPYCLGHASIAYRPPQPRRK